MSKKTNRLKAKLKSLELWAYARQMDADRSRQRYIDRLTHESDAVRYNVEQMQQNVTLRRELAIARKIIDDYDKGRYNKALVPSLTTIEVPL